MTTDPGLIGLSAGAALISAVSGVVTYYVRARGRERLAAIEGAPPEAKAKLVSDAVAMFDIPVEGLSSAQRVKLVLAQLSDRDRQRGRIFTLCVALMATLASTTIVLVLVDHSDSGPGAKAINPTVIPTMADAAAHEAIASPLADADRDPLAPPVAVDADHDPIAPSKVGPTTIIQTSGQGGVNIVGDHNTTSK